MSQVLLPNFSFVKAWISKGEVKGYFTSSLAYFQKDRLVKCEQEGLEQDRGDWGSLNTMAIYLGRGLQSHILFYLCLPVLSGSCEGVIGGANTKLVSSFMGSGPPSQGITGADLKSAHLAAGITAEVMCLSRYHL